MFPENKTLGVLGQKKKGIRWCLFLWKYGKYYGSRDILQRKIDTNTDKVLLPTSYENSRSQYSEWGLSFSFTYYSLNIACLTFLAHNKSPSSNGNLRFIAKREVYYSSLEFTLYRQDCILIF